MSTAYDQIHYPGKLHPQAHPDRLSTTGRLFGLDTPLVEGCRVLELGCGAGGNLIPAAFSLPGARFFGVDLSAAAISRASGAIRELGLANVEARQIDICELPDDIGTFDYVIAHGVYSWVPHHVRDRILALCRERLTPHGVAYVSYNAYPGCRLREIAREAMKYAANEIHTPSDIEESRRALDAVTTVSPAGDAYGGVLRAEVRRICEIEDGVLFHDDLAPINRAFYFHEFVKQAGEHRLQYLSDAEYADAADRVVQPELARLLDERAGDDVIRREQFADFVRGRTFRRTLLCRAGVALQRPASPRRLRGLHVASAARPVDPADTARFKTPRGTILSTSHAFARAALTHLAGLWPRGVAFEELLGVASVQGPEADKLGEFLLTAAAAGAVEFRTYSPAIALTPGERPIASALARWQAGHGMLVTTLAGTSVKLEGSLARQLLLLLDGTNDRQAIVARLAALAASGQIGLSEGGTTVAPERARQLLAAALDDKLVKLGRLGLLTE